MALGDFFKRRDIRKEKFREMQENDRLQHIMEERKKSANERELDKLRHRTREDAMAEELKQIRREESSNFFKSNMFFEDRGSPMESTESTTGGQLSRGNMLNSDNMFFKW